MHSKLRAGFLSLLLILIWPLAATAQNVGPPEWLVLAIQFIGEDTITPSSGIAVGGSRLLLPSEFVALGSDLYVLDGVMNIQHAKPATLLANQSELGWTLVEVKGLTRRAPIIATKPPQKDGYVQLIAFPDAAKLQQPTWEVRHTAQVAVRRNTPIISKNTVLPNLTGALTNACDQMLGLSSARGTPTSVRTGTTSYLWLENVQVILQRFGVQLHRSSECNQSLTSPVPEPVQMANLTSPRPQAISYISDQPQAQPQPNLQTNQQVPQFDAQIVRKDRVAQPLGANPEQQQSLPDLSGMTKSALAPETVAAIQKLLRDFGFYEGDVNGKEDADTLAALNEFLVSKHLSTRQSLSQASLDVLIQEKELNERESELASAGSEVVSASLKGEDARVRAAKLEGQLEETKQQPPQVKTVVVPVPEENPYAWLKITTVMALVVVLITVVMLSNRRLRMLINLLPKQKNAYTYRTKTSEGVLGRGNIRAVDGKFDLVIGRANANVLIKDPTVGRQHARLSGVGDEITIIDLGSRNGTFINRIQCAKGKSYSVHQSDDIQLGATRIVLTREVETDE